MSSKAEKEQEKMAKYKAEQEKSLKDIAKFQAQLRGIKTELDKSPLDERSRKKLKDDQKKAQKELDRVKGQLEKYKTKLERLPSEKQQIPMDRLSPSTEQIGMPGASSQPQSHSQSGQPQLQPGQPSLPQQYYDGGQIVPGPSPGAYIAASPPVAPSQPCSQPTLPPYMIPASPSPHPPTMQAVHLSEVIFACTYMEFHLQLHCLQCQQGCYKVVPRLSRSCDNLVGIISGGIISEIDL